MDIQCKHCGEPWEIAGLHELVGEGLFDDFEEARADFYENGCGTYSGGGVPCGNEPCVSEETLENIDMLQEALGDDVDGLAATLEDFSAAGIL